MALNPQYAEIGKGFVEQYCAIFDDPAQRPGLVNLYNVSIVAEALRIMHAYAAAVAKPQKKT